MTKFTESNYTFKEALEKGTIIRSYPAPGNHLFDIRIDHSDQNGPDEILTYHGAADKIVGRSYNWNGKDTKGPLCSYSKLKEETQFVMRNKNKRSLRRMALSMYIHGFNEEYVYIPVSLFKSEQDIWQHFRSGYYFDNIHLQLGYYGHVTSKQPFTHFHNVNDYEHGEYFKVHIELTGKAKTKFRRRDAWCYTLKGIIIASVINILLDFPMQILKLLAALLSLKALAVLVSWATVGLFIYYLNKYLDKLNKED